MDNNSHTIAEWEKLLSETSKHTTRMAVYNSGATVKPVSSLPRFTGSMPQIVADLEKQCEAVFGAAGVAQINQASGGQGGLTSAFAQCYALGLVHGRGLTNAPAPAPAAKAPVTPPPAPPKKTFPTAVSEFMATGKTKAEAVGAAVHKFPELHREWLASGQTEKL